VRSSSRLFLRELRQINKTRANEKKQPNERTQPYLSSALQNFSIYTFLSSFLASAAVVANKKDCRFNGTQAAESVIWQSKKESISRAAAFQFGSF
jgi:hypothetical protein